MSETTLGPAVVQIQQTDARKTIFGRFLLALKAGQTTQQPLMGGQVIWCDEPVELIALSGIWTIMSKLASLQDESINTTVQALSMAERVDRLVSAGMMLVHGSPEAAAAVFHNKVITLTREAHVLGYRPGMDIPTDAWIQLLAGNRTGFLRAVSPSESGKVGSLISYWQTPSTLFFATLVKAARDLRGRLERLTVDLKAANKLLENEEMTIFVCGGADVLLSYIPPLLDYLSEEQEGTKDFPEDLLILEDALTQQMNEVELFSRFAGKPKRWLIANSVVSVDSEWLNTQILLAYTREPVASNMLPSLGVYRQALRALQADDETKGVARVLHRLVKRAGKPLLTTGQKQILERKIRKYISGFRIWDASVVDDRLLSNVIANIGERELLLDPKTASKVAFGQEGSILEQVRSSGLDMEDWLAGVGMAILWPRLTQEQLEVIVEEAVLPDVVILDGLAGCEPSIAAAAVEDLLHLRPEPRSLNHAIRLGLIEVTVDLVRTHVQELDPDILGRELPTLLSFAASERGERFVPVFWMALIRAPKPAANALLRNRFLRRALCQVVEIGLDDANLSWGKVDNLREHLGPSDFEKVLLGAIALEREQMRRSSEAGKQMPWMQVIGTDFPAEIRLRVLGERATIEEARHLLAAVSEAQALSWAQGKS